MSENTDQSLDDFPMIYRALITEILTNYNRSQLTRPANQITQTVIFTKNHRAARVEIDIKPNGTVHYIQMWYKEGRISFRHSTVFCSEGATFTNGVYNPSSSFKIIDLRDIDICDPCFFKKCNRVLRYLIASIRLHIQMETEDTEDTGDFTVEVMTAEYNK